VRDGNYGQVISSDKHSNMCRKLEMGKDLGKILNAVAVLAGYTSRNCAEYQKLRLGGASICSSK
jgi:hypothetical protein